MQIAIGIINNFDAAGIFKSQVSEIDLQSSIVKIQMSQTAFESAIVKTLPNHRPDVCGTLRIVNKIVDVSANLKTSDDTTFRPRCESSKPFCSIVIVVIIIIIIIIIIMTIIIIIIIMIITMSSHQNAHRELFAPPVAAAQG